MGERMFKARQRKAFNLDWYIQSLILLHETVNLVFCLIKIEKAVNVNSIVYSKKVDMLKFIFY